MKRQTDGCTYVRTYVRMVDDVMAIKPNFLASMGYQYFLSYGAPLLWSYVSRLNYMKRQTDGRTYVRTYVRMVDDVMAIKPNFLASMGYQYFLSYGAPLL